MRGHVYGTVDSILQEMPVDVVNLWEKESEKEGRREFNLISKTN